MVTGENQKPTTDKYRQAYARIFTRERTLTKNEATESTPTHSKHAKGIRGCAFYVDNKDCTISAEDEARINKAHDLKADSLVKEASN